MKSTKNKKTTAPTVSKTTPLWVLGMLVICVFLLQTSLARVVQEISPEGNMLKLISMMKLLVSIFFPVWAVIFIFRLPVRDTIGLYSPSIKKLIIAVVLGFILIIGINMILPRIIQPTRTFVQKTGSIVTYKNLPGFLLTFLMISIVAPLVDEFFFRGILLRGLLVRYGPAVTILGTAVLTALFHPLEPFKLLHSFLMGVIFASSALWTKSVYTPLVLHCMHNSLALIPQG